MLFANLGVPGPIKYVRNSFSVVSRYIHSSNSDININQIFILKATRLL